MSDWARGIVLRNASCEEIFSCGKTRCEERRFIWRDASCGETLCERNRFVRGTFSYAF